MTGYESKGPTLTFNKSSLIQYTPCLKVPYVQG